MIARLAASSLLRARARTLLAVLGVAVSAAMLLDMVMLASGMRESFRALLTSRGFQLRLSPKGTLPFDTEATIPGATRVRATLLSDPRVEAVSPVLGGQLHVPASGGAVSAIALGVDPRVQGDYEVVAGREPAAPDQAVASEDFLRATSTRVGDTVSVAAGYDPQLRAFTGRRRLALVGKARFIYMPSGTRAVAVQIGTLQAMGGRERTDRASLFMVRLRDGTDVERVRRDIAARLPSVSAISTATALQQVDERLSYFRQLAFILGAISLVVGFLLVTTLVTVSVNERLGEIAVLRAIGVTRARVVLQIVLEGVGIMAVGAAGGLLLGVATARYLNSILAAFPGLPERIDFFLFQPRDAWAALAMLAVSGVLAGIYPSWRGASLPIATTLRDEATI